jgi:dTDP-4-amino-4,6-dideoxygalactose transaminase
MNARLPAIEGGTPVRTTPLPFSPPAIGEAEIEAVTGVLRSGWITRGPMCERFEKRLCALTGASHCVVLSSATAGLFLTLRAAGIGPGDEVVTTPYTFAATASAIVHTGAVPVFADTDPGGFHISPRELEAKITGRTRAVIPVHYGGQPAEMDAIHQLADPGGILLVEDAAHALGASYRGTPVGAGENPAVFSFHAVKNVTTAEGGAVMTSDPETAGRIRLLSLHGQTRDAREKLARGGWQYDIADAGYKFNMTDLQAALGLAQLDRMEKNQRARASVAARYGEALRRFDMVRLPDQPEHITHSWHLYPLRIDFSSLRIDRDRFIEALWAENIPSNVHYIPVHLMSYYRKRFGFAPGDFPNSHEVYLSEITLPLYPGMSGRDTGDVIEAVVRVLEHYRR